MAQAASVTCANGLAIAIMLVKREGTASVAGVTGVEIDCGRVSAYVLIFIIAVEVIVCTTPITSGAAELSTIAGKRVGWAELKCRGASFGFKDFNDVEVCFDSEEESDERRRERDD